eukprot:NODE_904_length_659_cov_79.175410_g834_i0.p1 GENE.NODE_904_length_659_cov_79.175410_g834_i0~~NODE_904_length_659_cov_79.175410_g834_i0.p1  ORF type:complete len:123 (-),score=11.71 NODE_904_length_659_cov_79.175410_g834_i0:129-497(-)
MPRSPAPKLLALPWVMTTWHLPQLPKELGELVKFNPPSPRQSHALIPLKSLHKVAIPFMYAHTCTLMPPYRTFIHTYTHTYAHTHTHTTHAHILFFVYIGVALQHGVFVLSGRFVFWGCLQI